MTEEEAREWIKQGFGQTAVDALTAFASILVDETERQNLIAPSTIPTLWTRHMLDSAQLVPLAPRDGTWLDIGTGAGFPGLVVAILRREHTALVEPRRQRAEFLARVATELKLAHVEVVRRKIESVAAPARVISARAVAPVEKLLQGASGCATTATRWLLPRGRMDRQEMDALRKRWRGVFHMKQSLSDPASTIVVADGIARR